MKTAFTAALYAVLSGGSPSAYGIDPKGKESSLSGTSFRRNPAAEIRQFGQTWRLPVHQVVAVLVFLRALLHNRLVLRHHPMFELSVSEAEVLFGYARWLDGFPPVIRALPEPVMLEEPVVVKLKVPRFLPADLAPLVQDAPADARGRAPLSLPARPSNSRGSGAPSNKGAARHDDRRFGFVKNPVSVPSLLPRGGMPTAKVPRGGLSDRR